MPQIKSSGSVESVFSDYWNDEKTKAIREICEAERIDPEAFRSMIETYHFSGKRPLQGAVVDALTEKPKILERKSVVERIVGKLLKRVATFDDGIGAI